MKRISNLVFAAVAVFVMVGCNNSKEPKVERVPYTITQSETNEMDCVAHLNNGVDVHLDSWAVKSDIEKVEGLEDTISICLNVEWEMKRVVEVLNREYKGYAIVPNSDYNQTKSLTYKYNYDGIILYYEWKFEVVSPQNTHYVITFNSDMGKDYKGYYKITNIIIL